MIARRHLISILVVTAFVLLVPVLLFQRADPAGPAPDLNRLVLNIALGAVVISFLISGPRSSPAVLLVFSLLLVAILATVATYFTTHDRALSYVISGLLLAVGVLLLREVHRRRVPPPA